MYPTLDDFKSRGAPSTRSRPSSNAISPMNGALKRSLRRDLLMWTLTLALSACYEPNTPSISSVTSAPELPELRLSTPVRGAFLGIWGAERSGESLTSAMTEHRVWFSGGYGGDSPAQSTSLIAVYEPPEAGEDPSDLSDTDPGQLRLHYEASGGVLWWVWGSGRRGEVWTAGDQGTILRLDEQSSETQPWVREEVRLYPQMEGGDEVNEVDDDRREELGDKLVIWGLWGTRGASGALTLWAVGGSVRRGGPKGVLLKRDAGGVWRRVTHEFFPIESEDDPLRGANFYKIWGRDDTVWIVGERGVTLTADIEQLPETSQLSHWRVSSTSPEISELLFTVHGSPTPETRFTEQNANGHSTPSTSTTWVVGGYDRGSAWRWNQEGEMSGSGAWEALDLPTIPALNGVYVDTDLVIGVGRRGSVSAWNPHVDLGSTSSITQGWVSGADLMTLHSIWPYRKGGYWIVGGDLTTLREGAILAPHQWSTTGPPLRRQTW